jgi:hypothetical protein
MFERLKRPVGAPGSIRFPSAHLPDALPVDARFFKRLTKERPKVIPGQDGTSWADQPSDQEPWDCLVGCYVGLEALYSMKGGSKLRARLEAPPAPAAAPAEADAPDAPVPVADTPPVVPAPIEAVPSVLPPWKQTPEQRAAAQAAKAQAQAQTKAPSQKRQPFQMVRSSFVSR